MPPRSVLVNQLVSQSVCLVFYPIFSIIKCKNTLIKLSLKDNQDFSLWWKYLYWTETKQNRTSTTPSCDRLPRSKIGVNKNGFKLFRLQKKTTSGHRNNLKFCIDMHNGLSLLHLKFQRPNIHHFYF